MKIIKLSFTTLSFIVALFFNCQGQSLHESLRYLEDKIHNCVATMDQDHLDTRSRVTHSFLGANPKGQIRIRQVDIGKKDRYQNTQYTFMYIDLDTHQIAIDRPSIDGYAVNCYRLWIGTKGSKKVVDCLSEYGYPRWTKDTKSMAFIQVFSNSEEDLKRIKNAFIRVIKLAHEEDDDDPFKE